MLKYWCHNHGPCRTQRMLEKGTVEGNESPQWFGNWQWVFDRCIKNKAETGSAEGLGKPYKRELTGKLPTGNPQERKFRSEIKNRQYLQQAENKWCHQHLGQSPGQIPNPKPSAKGDSLPHKDRTSPKTLKPQSETPNQLLYHAVWDPVVLVAFPCPGALWGALLQLEELLEIL